MMSDEFTHSGYRALLEKFLERGYEARGYEDARPDETHLIVRHDIDMSLPAAEPVAEIEHELGITSHFFVLLQTEMYNSFSASSQNSLKHISDLGHKIGLHLDASIYQNDLSRIDEAAAQECEILELAAGHSIEVISFHRPAKTLLGYDGLLAGRRHAYEPCFFEEMGYISDSRGGWHYGNPLNHEAFKAGRAIQLLTHPIWWSGTGNDNPQGKLDKFVAERYDILRSELASNCETYQYNRQSKQSS